MPRSWDCPGREAGQDIRSSRRVAALQGGQARGSWAVTPVTDTIPHLDQAAKVHSWQLRGLWALGRMAVSHVRDQCRKSTCSRTGLGRQPRDIAGVKTATPGWADLASWAMEQALTPARKGHYCTEEPWKKGKDLAHMPLMVLMVGLKKIPCQRIVEAINSTDRISLPQVHASLT